MAHHPVTGLNQESLLVIAVAKEDITEAYEGTQYYTRQFANQNY